MDKEITDTITVFLDQLHESENVLKYTLQLPQASSDAIKLPELPSSDMDKAAWLEFGKKSKDSVKTAEKTTYENCEYLFNNSNPNLYGYKSNTASDLSILSIHTPFWRHAFTQDMVLSAFVKLRKLIGQSIDMTSYTFVKYSNYANDSEVPSLFGKRYHGLDYLTGCASAVSDEYMRLKTIGGKTFELEEVLPSSVPSGYIPPYASNCSRQIKTLYKRLKILNNNNRYFKSLEKENEAEMSKVGLDVFEFCEFAISQHREGGSKNILPIIKSYKEGCALSISDYEKYIECICNLHLQNRIEAIDKNIKYKALEPVMEHNMSLSDKIYLRYQIEDLFSPVMIDCIYRNILPTVDTSYSMDDQATVNLLSSCLTLPNVFTRQYIFQMGMDTIIKHPDYDFGASDFFSQYQIDARAIVISARTKTNYLRRQMNLSIFLNRYAHFVNYLGHMLLPVYENYFLILLWNSVKNTFPEKSEGDSILYLYELLRHLLNDKDFVEELFSTEDVILNAAPKFHKLKPEHILHPSFSASQDIKLYLYKRCLLSQNIAAKQEVPSFLNLEYLNSLATEPSKYVQSYYIRSFNTMQ